MYSVRRCQREMQRLGFCWSKQERRLMSKMSVSNLIHAQTLHRHWEIYLIVSNLPLNLMKGIFPALLFSSSVPNLRRYRSGSSESLNILGDIEENAFTGEFNVVLNPMPPDEDLVNEDVPFNLAFVESYYGDQSKFKPSPESSRSEQIGRAHV